MVRWRNREVDGEVWGVTCPVGRPARSEFRTSVLSAWRGDTGTTGGVNESRSARSTHACVQIPRPGVASKRGRPLGPMGLAAKSFLIDYQVGKKIVPDRR